MVVVLDLLRNSAFVDFQVLLSRFSILFWGAISTFRIWPPKKESKIGQNNPENRRSLSYARGLFLLFLWCLPLQANVVNSLEADIVDYDSKKIRLNGHVHIVHQFGEIRCSKAVLLFDAEGQDKLSPSRILLDQDVSMVLKDGSLITSDEADIDCKTLVGVFVCTPPSKVSYLTRVVDHNEAVPVKATSRAMRILMKKTSGPKPEYVVADVQGEGAVSIEYLNNTDEKSEENQ